MARHSAMRKAEASAGDAPAEGLTAVPGAAGGGGGGGDAGRAGNPVAFDRLIHERVRLAIVSALAGHDALSFSDLKSALGITDGNLSVHARKLEDAGYIACSKSFEGRMPRTEYRLTDAGRAALERYVDHMAALIDTLRDR